MILNFATYQKLFGNYFLQKNKKKIPESYIRFFGENKKVSYLKTHKNNVDLFYVHSDQFFRKYSTSKQGIRKINSEKEGLSWYCKRVKVNKRNVIRKYYKKKNLAFIDIKKIQGKKIRSWRSLEKNFIFVLKVVNHYKKVFGRKKYSKIHGDLTLDNVLFNKKSLFLIDWEFYGSDKKIWGYDIVYFVLSSVSLPYLAKKSFSAKDKELFIKLWKSLINMKIEKRIIYNPFNFFKNQILKDKFLNINSRLSKKKFYPLYTPKVFQRKLINIIKGIK